MDKLWYLSRISIFDSLSPEDFKEIDMMAPMTHFNAVPKGTLSKLLNIIATACFS